jgi:hypothetical protein
MSMMEYHKLGIKAFPANALRQSSEARFWEKFGVSCRRQSFLLHASAAAALDVRLLSLTTVP